MTVEKNLHPHAVLYIFGPKSMFDEPTVIPNNC